jgi:hypothetical protein
MPGEWAVAGHTGCARPSKSFRSLLLYRFARRQGGNEPARRRSPRMTEIPPQPGDPSGLSEQPTAPPERRDETGGRRLARWARFGQTGWRAVIAMSAGIVAIAAAVSVVLKFLPGGSSAALRATVDDIRVQDEFPWKDYRTTNTFAMRPISRITAIGDAYHRPTRILLLAQVIATQTTPTQTTPTQTTPTQTTPTQTTPTQTTPTQTTPTQIETTTTTTTTGTPTTTQTRALAGRVGSQVPLLPGQEHQIVEAQKTLSNETATPPSCRPANGQECALTESLTPVNSSSGPYVEVAYRDGDAQVNAYKHVLFVLRHARSTAGPGGKRQILGAKVDYRVELRGYGGHVADVRWSLQSADGGQAPEAWEQQHEADHIKAVRPDEVLQLSLFVPLPQRVGRYEIELSVFDEHRTVQGRAFTNPFR